MCSFGMMIKVREEEELIEVPAEELVIEEATPEKSTIA